MGRRRAYYAYSNMPCGKCGFPINRGEEFYYNEGDKICCECWDLLQICYRFMADKGFRDMLKTYVDEKRKKEQNKDT